MCTASSIGAPSRLRVTRLMPIPRSEEHTSELQSRSDLVCRLLLEKKKIKYKKLTFIGPIAAVVVTRLLHVLSTKHARGLVAHHRVDIYAACPSRLATRHKESSLV